MKAGTHVIQAVVNLKCSRFKCKFHKKTLPHIWTCNLKVTFQTSWLLSSHRDSLQHCNILSWPSFGSQSWKVKWSSRMDDSIGGILYARYDQPNRHTSRHAASNHPARDRSATAHCQASLAQLFDWLWILSLSLSSVWQVSAALSPSKCASPEM